MDKLTLYADTHREPVNLCLHLLAVPLFIGAHISVLWALIAQTPLPALGLLMLPISLALQGYGHRLETRQPTPFSGKGDFIRRIYREQFFTFPRYVFTSHFWRSLSTKH